MSDETKPNCGKTHCGWDAESGVCWADTYGLGCGATRGESAAPWYDRRNDGPIANQWRHLAVRYPERVDAGTLAMWIVVDRAHQRHAAAEVERAKWESPKPITVNGVTYEYVGPQPPTRRLADEDR